MNEIINRDENRVIVGAAVTDDVDLDITMLRTDPTSKRLLVKVGDDTTSNVNTGSIASRDENRVTVVMGYDELNDELVEIATDENGYIICQAT